MSTYFAIASVLAVLNAAPQATPAEPQATPPPPQAAPSEPQATTKPPILCRSHPNVKASMASDEVNRAAGGHVGMHMKDATSLPKGETSQLNKTAFKDWATFKNAYKQWEGANLPPNSSLKGPITCGAKGNDYDCIKADVLGVDAAWTCAGVDAKTGLCNNWQMLSGSLYVGFWYVNNPQKTKGKWILMTAYPSTNKDCR